MGHQRAVERALGLIRDVPDHPAPGVLFRDITPLLADAEAFGLVVEAMAEPAAGSDVVVGLEARGFLLGAAVANAAGLGVIPVRKAGKLPAVAARREYRLEYGTATLELPAGVLRPGVRAYLVDDVLATGGTLVAGCELVEQAGAQVSGAGVLIELAALGGRARLGARPLHTLLIY